MVAVAVEEQDRREVAPAGGRGCGALSLSQVRDLRGQEGSGGSGLEQAATGKRMGNLVFCCCFEGSSQAGVTCA